MPLPGLGRAPPLETARLLLRPPAHADLPAIAALANDWELTKWMGRLPHPYGEEDALFFLHHVVPHEVAWLIQSRAGEVLGIAGLVPHGAASAELGYWLGRPHWGHGFATEAARAILAFAFTTAALPELTSGCFTGNLRSARVLEKLGFRQTGTSTRACLAQAKDLPHLDMRLPRTAWTPPS